LVLHLALPTVTINPHGMERLAVVGTFGSHLTGPQLLIYFRLTFLRFLDEALVLGDGLSKSRLGSSSKLIQKLTYRKLGGVFSDLSDSVGRPFHELTDGLFVVNVFKQVEKFCL
jgi:hypothetical protein